jgi:hypothetical protein
MHVWRGPGVAASSYPRRRTSVNDGDRAAGAEVARSDRSGLRDQREALHQQLALDALGLHRRDGGVGAQRGEPRGRADDGGRNGQLVKVGVQPHAVVARRRRAGPERARLERGEGAEARLARRRGCGLRRIGRGRLGGRSRLGRGGARRSSSGGRRGGGRGAAGGGRRDRRGDGGGAERDDHPGGLAAREARLQGVALAAGGGKGRGGLRTALALLPAGGAVGRVAVGDRRWRGRAGGGGVSASVKGAARTRRREDRREHAGAHTSAGARPRRARHAWERRPGAPGAAPRRAAAPHRRSRRGRPGGRPARAARSGARARARRRGRSPSSLSAREGARRGQGGGLVSGQRPLPVFARARPGPGRQRAAPGAAPDGRGHRARRAGADAAAPRGRHPGPRPPAKERTRRAGVPGARARRAAEAGPRLWHG